MALLWERSAQIFPHDGTTPLIYTGATLSTNTEGVVYKRVILDVELSVVVESGGAGFQLEYWQDVLLVVGVGFVTDIVTPTPPFPTPLTDPNPPNRWLAWEKMYPQVNTYDTLTPFETVTWRTAKSQVDVHGQVRIPTSLRGTVGLTWQLSDPSGLINTNVGGVTYYLGGNFSVSVLSEVP